MRSAWPALMMTLRVSSLLAVLALASPAGATDDESTAPSVPPPAPQGPAVSPSGILRINSDARPVMVTVAPRDQSGTAVAQCMTPCALTLPIGPWTVETMGRGLRANSRDIDLAPGGAALRFHSATRAGFGGGLVLSIGGGVMATALTALAIGAFTASPGDPYNQFMGELMLGMGAVIGAPLLIAGLVLAIRHTSRSTVISSSDRFNHWTALAPRVDGAGLTWQF